MPRKKQKTPLFHFTWEVRRDSEVVVQDTLRTIDFMAAREKVDKLVAELLATKKLPAIPQRIKSDYTSRWKPIREEMTGRIYHWYADKKTHRVSIRIRRTADPVDVEAFVRSYLKKLKKPCYIDDLYRSALAAEGRCDKDTFDNVLRKLGEAYVIQRFAVNQSVQWIPPAKREAYREAVETANQAVQEHLDALEAAEQAQKAAEKATVQAVDQAVALLEQAQEASQQEGN